MPIVGFMGPLFIFYSGVILVCVADSLVCGLYFITQRCSINGVCDSFVCGSVGPNPHALSALTMSTT